MSDNSGTLLKVTAAAVQAVQRAALKSPVSPIKAYSCDLHILDAVKDSQQVAVWPWKTGVKPNKWILL